MTSSSSASTHPGRALLLLCQPTILVVVVVIGFIYWPVPAFVDIQFRVSAACPRTVLQFESVPVQHAQIHYVNFPEIPPISVQASASFEVYEGSEFKFTSDIKDEITFCRVKGQAENIEVVSTRGKQSLALTRFEVLKHRSWEIAFGGAVWLVLTAVSWFRVYHLLNT